MTIIRYMEIDPATNQPVVRERQSTLEEDAQATAQVNRSTLEQRADNALVANKTAITQSQAFLAIANPTNAQNAAQVKALTQQQVVLTQQMNGVIRLLLGRLDATD